MNGTVVENDKAEATKIYGRPWSNREIIRGGVAVPQAAKELAAELAVRAGRLILECRARGIAVTAKADRSVVTDADNAAEALILEGLRRADPGVPIIAEEATAAGEAPFIIRVICSSGVSSVSSSST